MSVMEREPVRSRRSFTDEFKRDAVALVIDEGRTVVDVARRLGVGEGTVGNWVRQARVDRGDRAGVTTSERTELVELRLTEELAHRGRVVNHKRVRRLMRNHGIVGVHKPAKVRTTLPAEECPPLPDLVGRHFAPAAPDVVWCVTSPTSRPVKGGCTS